MPEEVLFEVERRTSRREIADYLRAVAESLEADEAVTLSAGDQEVTLDPPASPTFEVKAERETSGGGGPGELSLELEIEWDEDGGDGDGGGDAPLRID